MSRLEQLLTSPSTPPDAVAGVPADELARLVLDRGQPWWRRRTCATALDGQAPAEHAAALRGVACDPEVTTEVRAAVLDVLPHSDELLTWLRGEHEDTYNLDLAVLRTRARLGDTTAVPELVELAADPWPHRHKVGSAALDLLGVPTVLAALDADSASALLQHSTEAVRLLGVRWADDIAPALADESTVVAREAHDHLIHLPGEHAELTSMAAAGNLWALAVLAGRGEDVRDRRLALGPPLVDVPGLPQDIREAIVRQYTPGTRGTDPRWLLEAAHLPPAPPDSLPAAMAALAHLNPAPPISAGDLNQQGEGTYHRIETTAGDVIVSTLGRFYSGTPHIEGFREIDDELGDIVVTGLSVYFFGQRGPLPVRDLLFYWQD